MEILEKRYKFQIDKICKSYNRDVLCNICVNVYDGEFLTILGPSGCGKTTLIRIIVGLLQPTSGKIIMDGVYIANKQALERNIGIVFQNFALFENMTVRQNIEYALKVRKINKMEINEISTKLSEKTGQLEAVLEAGITEIYIVRGYLAPPNLISFLKSIQ
ncbi:MAG: ATP-binding cassette domain-containing protein [Anaerorhabdus sp.]|uniref:ATP-binding cassette domain-containing protein n=1 Tax=Anaerorhabdus sp. TaxID=1872524 RepID=UPI002FCADF69